MEYKAYHDIRYDKQPNMKKLFQNLETVIEKSRSTRACNMLAEFNQVQDKKEGSQSEAAKYYQISAEQGDMLGVHWMGVFYHLAFGVGKDIPKAIEYLKRAAKEGNGQSCYQLAIIHLNEEGYIDVPKAYHYFEKALLTGVSFFDEFHGLFKQHQDTLSPIFLEKKQPNTLIQKDNKTEVLNLHEAYVSEMKSSFSAALGKDRLYQRAVGFMQDQQIWMVGVLARYFVKHALHFDHTDFMKALKQDVNPILGELGAWVLTNMVNRQREKGKTEKKKQAQVALDLVKNFLENGFDHLSLEKKYHFINKFSPKKLPALAEKRSSLPHLYSWIHYAPIQWFDHLKKLEEELKTAEERKKNADLVKKCSFCTAPESDLRKHKVCSACKSAFYCTTDCQKYDWQKKHKGECKELAAKAAAAAKKTGK
ncbi:hypothetical protein FGO68_gene17252 [Halteria grandinella]|uniref:MYND-type domain-containing protein n=1 Tax=Halteria grandinella TaxID=5974 RepID=A0A8J8NCV2_HALGN|nr:hypothetical protein FGO68_gene17252 [Halteria grandinella]